jgi:ABC-2 type transport system ATP-binding protein
MIAPFGAALHVSGNDREQLEAAIEPFRRDPWRWTEVSPSLEDVFIHLMRERGGQQAQQDAAAA